MYMLQGFSIMPIAEKKADFIISLKGNQQPTHNDVRGYHLPSLNNKRSIHSFFFFYVMLYFPPL